MRCLTHPPATPDSCSRPGQTGSGVIEKKVPLMSIVDILTGGFSIWFHLILNTTIQGFVAGLVDENRIKTGDLQAKSPEFTGSQASGNS